MKKNPIRIDKKQTKAIKKVIIVFIFIQITIVALLFFTMYQNKKVTDSNTTQISILVEDTLYIPQAGRANGEMIVYSNSDKYYFDVKYSQWNGYDSEKLSDELIGNELDITYKEFFTIYGFRKFIVDARDANNVYFSIDDYNYEQSGQLKVGIIAFIVFEILLLLVSSFAVFLVIRLW